MPPQLRVSGAAAGDPQIAATGEKVSEANSCEGTGTVHELLARIASEYDRVCKANVQLHGMILAQQNGTQPATSPNQETQSNGCATAGAQLAHASSMHGFTPDLALGGRFSMFDGAGALHLSMPAVPRKSRAPHGAPRSRSTRRPMPVVSRESASAKAKSRPPTLECTGTGRFHVLGQMEQPGQQSGSSFNVTEHETPLLTTRFKRVVKGQGFNIASGCIIMAQTAFLGYEANWLATNLHQRSDHLEWVHAVFNLAFLVELITRIMADGFLFFYGEGWRWNWFDTALVIFSGVELILFTPASHSGEMRSLRFGRILRWLRALRIAHTIRFVHELQKMLYAVMSSLRTLLCSSLILCFVMYFFSILFTAASAEERAMHSAPTSLLDEYYGTFGRTLLTLYWAMSGGISWSEVYEPIVSIHWLYGFLFLIYMFIVLFGVLNIVAAVFVESALMSAQHYRELFVKEAEIEKAVAVRHMKHLFDQMDTDGSGEISSEEMDCLLLNPDARRLVDALGLDADDARMLFCLLDVDDSGVINVDEFCDGCLKLKGEARSIDVHILLLRVNGFLKSWADFTDFVETHIPARLAEVDTA